MCELPAICPHLINTVHPKVEIYILFKDAVQVEQTTRVTSYGKGCDSDAE